jgi:hypothetical protein
LLASLTSPSIAAALVGRINHLLLEQGNEAIRRCTMNPRNRILALVFAVLFLGVMMVEQPWRGDAHARTDASTLRMFPDLIEHDGIGRVRIQSSEQTTTIARVVEQGKPRWVVRELWDHPADLDRVSSLIESLQALQTRDIESVNPEMQDAYEVGEGTGVRVEVWDENGELLADLIAGGMRSQDVTAGQTAVFEFFVRPTASNVVYRTGEFSVPYSKPSDWCDTHFLARVLPEQVHTLHRTDRDADQSWKLMRGSDWVAPTAEQMENGDEGSGKWQMVAPFALEVPDFVGDSWVHTLVGLRAETVIGKIDEELLQAQLEPVTDILRAGIGGEEMEIHIGKPAGDKLRAARVVGLPHLYALAEFDVDQLLQSVEKMRRAD